GEGIVEAGRIDRKLHGGLRALARRILERDQGSAQDAVLRGAFDIAQALTFVGSEGGDIDQADDVAGRSGGVGDHRTRVRVADGADRAGNLVEHAGNVGGGTGEATQW